ncbi:NAD(P)-dependent oxidoreductase, partial [Streptomyces narbonensis]|uniref:NAD-dependent epimerase/dehydratase family protein n=1 Tax=Streptomyces narbonensis TaxID=67333 RepID=UPI0033E94F49
MRVLVTGGAGFIGSHIVAELIGHGHDPVVFDLAEDGRDVRDPQAVRDALAGVDAVCHQAAKVGLGKDFGDAPQYVSANDLGTAVLLAGMAETGVRRLLLAGSMVVYGEGRYACAAHGVVRPGPRAEADLKAGRFEPRCPECGADLAPGLVAEDAPMDPRNVYATTKLAQEHLAAAWARAIDGRVTCCGRRCRGRRSGSSRRGPTSTPRKGRRHPV